MRAMTRRMACVGFRAALQNGNWRDNGHNDHRHRIFGKATVMRTLTTLRV
jgi:hypothetical protein